MRPDAEAQALAIGGVPWAVWWDAWRACHRLERGGSGKRSWIEPERTAWPDGSSYIEQAHLTVEMFDVITAQVRESTR